MNAIKSKTRNKLNIEHLDNLMRIKSYILQEKKIDLDEVYNIWINRKERREKILNYEYMYIE